ncbi:MAG: hypothetical protein WBB19_03245 [Desulforhopalus sp.]
MITSDICGSNYERNAGCQSNIGLIIVALATLESFYIDSIIDATHIATFIASTSTFFVLMGGMFWKRATSSGIPLHRNLSAGRAGPGRS